MGIGQCRGDNIEQFNTTSAALPAIVCLEQSQEAVFPGHFCSKKEIYNWYQPQNITLPGFLPLTTVITWHPPG